MVRSRYDIFGKIEEIPGFFPCQVKIKSPGAETAAKTAARRRLESYADAQLPRLLGSRSTGTKRCEQRAVKAPRDHKGITTGMEWTLGKVGKVGRVSDIL